MAQSKSKLNNETFEDASNENYKIQFKRTKTGSSRPNNITLSYGEPYYDKESNKLYIGDGSKTLGNLYPIGGTMSANEIVTALNGRDGSDTDTVLNLKDIDKLCGIQIKNILMQDSEHETEYVNVVKRADCATHVQYVNGKDYSAEQKDITGKQ